MAMTVRRRRDIKVPSVVMHRVADIRGGVSIKASELGGDYLMDGTALSAPVDGICHVVKTAKVVGDVVEDGKTINVAKGSHFVVGEFVLLDEKSKAVKITKIDKTSSTAHDVITIDAALGAITKGSAIAQAKAAAATDTSELMHKPLAIAGSGKIIEVGDNLDVDAWLIAVTHGNALPECVMKYLKGIINY